MSLSILGILVTQVGFRNEAQLKNMIMFARSGGFFNKESINRFNIDNPGTQSGWPIKISRFEDGQLFCADGHHRLAAIVMSGRSCLHDSEYEIQDWKYSDYIEINFACRWVTPFDPRSEIRISDYSYFKNNVYDLFKVSEAEAIKFIRKNKSMYTISRESYNIYDILARRMFNES